MTLNSLPNDRACGSVRSSGVGEPSRHHARLDRVAVTFGRTPVLRELDLIVDAGETLGMLGANGSGKTTLLRLLATLIKPTAGRGEVLGRALGSAECAAARRAICLVGHQPALYPRLSLAENIRFVARILGLDEAAADRALRTVGLGGAAQRRADHCSQGMLRRAELARVLLWQPSLLLLDEIHASLDHDAAGLVADVVADVRDRGGACVLVAHEPDRLVGIVDRAVRITDGHADPICAATRPGRPR